VTRLWRLGGMELLGAVIEDHRGGLGLSAVGTKWLLG